MMVVGTSSHAGKSWTATAICRWLRRRGVRVAPFKAQNMSLNSFPCVDGGEIGRAQVAQAEACGLEPRADMNPILLKPTAHDASQVIVNGRVWKQLSARDYYAHYEFLLGQVMAAFERLAAEFEFIVMEGAGSASEINLRSRDLVNLPLAVRLRRSGDAGGRYRPRRRVRLGRRHVRSARALREGIAAEFCDQPLSRRPGDFRRGLRDARAASRAAVPGRVSLCAKTSASTTRISCRSRSALGRTLAARNDAVPGTVCESRSSGCRASRTSPIFGCCPTPTTSRAPLAEMPDCIILPGQQEHSRRPAVAARTGARPLDSGLPRARRLGVGNLRRLPDARAGARCGPGRRRVERWLARGARAAAGRDGDARRENNARSERDVRAQRRGVPGVRDSHGRNPARSRAANRGRVGRERDETRGRDVLRLGRRQTGGLLAAGVAGTYLHGALETPEVLQSMLAEVARRRGKAFDTREIRGDLQAATL